MDDDLICNYKKCRKRLNANAWVTSCSHIFCDEDGGREFGKQPVCPACETQLPGKFDIIRVDLQPSEQYKSMVLAGQRPEIIMEICSRAMSFWVYQAHQERAYQEYCASRAVEKAQQQESYYEQLVAVNHSEVSSLRSQVVAMKNELEVTRARYNESSDKLQEKNRQYQKLQGMYETLRRRNVTPSSFDSDPAPNPHHKFSLRQHQPQHFEIPLGALPDKDSVGLPHGHLGPVHRSSRQPVPMGFSLHAATASSSVGPMQIPIPSMGGTLLVPSTSTTSHPLPLPLTSSHSHLDPSTITGSSQHAAHHRVVEGKSREVFNIRMAAPPHTKPTKS